MRPKQSRQEATLLRLAFNLRAPCVMGILMVAFISASARAAVGSFIEGEVIARFKPSAGIESARGVAMRHSAQVATHFRWLSERKGRVFALLRSRNRTTAELIAELKTDPAIDLVEPNYWRHTCAMRSPNDLHFPKLWGLQNRGQSVNGSSGIAQDDIQFLPAWGMARPTTNEIVVAVIDTGIDLAHPDLQPNLWSNPGEIAGNGIDDDADGYVDDLHGYNFIDGNNNLNDSGDHGTHVAGTVVAAGNNNVGIIGVDFLAHVMALKTSNDGDSLSDAAIIEAIQYATMMKIRGVNVVAINGSFGGPDYGGTMSDAIQIAGEAGIVFCAAAGNSGDNNDYTPTYPASYRLPNMIVVAASDSDDSLAGFSNYGPSTVDLAAPGVNIFSCMPTWKAGTTALLLQGTNSFAAAQFEYSGLTTTNGITGSIYYCGLGYEGDFPPEVNGNIALIERGILHFSQKVSNAMAAGARAAIIYNNSTTPVSGTLEFESSWIPSILISLADGERLRPNLPAIGTVINAWDPAQVYQFLDGTSMAAPHVAGAVAFAARNFPAETVAERIQRILSSAAYVPALAGIVVTSGRLNLASMVDADGNGLPDWWELQFFSSLTGTDPAADPDQDGANNLEEWLAGTDPTNCDSRLSLTIARPGGTNVPAIQWPSAPGRFYRLLRGTNLATGFNSVVFTNIPAAPPMNSQIDPAPAPASFYRLQIEP